MTNEEMLLMALTGEELPENLTFHPQNNKQAYLAYAVGLLTDPEALPEPRTNEEALLKELALSGPSAGDGESGGVVLPTLLNAALAAEILSGKEVIDADGKKMVGTMPDNGAVDLTLDANAPTVLIARGFHDGNGKVAIILEEKTVTPSSAAQEITPSDGKVLGKVVVEAAQGGVGDDFEITNASHLFRGGARVNILDALVQHLGKITSAEGMFFEDKTNRIAVDLRGIDASELKFTQNMFNNCIYYSSINLAGWDTKKLTNMNHMFAGCSSLQTLDLSGWDTSAVTNMGSLFSYTGLKSIDISALDTSAVTDMSSMFNGSSNLETITGIENLDVSNASVLTSMFINTKIARIDMSSWDTRKATNMGSMFSSCKSLEEIIGFSSPAKAGMSNAFPYGTTSAPMPLKRLTFRTDLDDGLYSIRSAIDIRYCSFVRNGMVEMFNSLPDVSALGLSSNYTKITITGNPCVLSTISVSNDGGVTYATYADLEAALRKRFQGVDPKDATVKYHWSGQSAADDVTTTFGEITEEMFEQSGKSMWAMTYGTTNVPEDVRLTDEDRAIATNKGWTLVE